MLFISIVFTLILTFCFADYDETFLFCKTPPPKLKNGVIKRDRVSFYRGQGYLGNMEYMCLPGFNLIGNKIVSCGQGIWTTMPQCIPKNRCSPIDTYPVNTMIESDNITFFQNDPQQIVVGSMITLRCIDNYEFDPISSGSLQIQCQNDGSWTPMPNCRYAQATCDYSKLYLPDRSRITQMNLKFSESNRQLHVVGSSLEYSCEDGYRLHDGKTSLIVECLPSGSWSPLPICEFVYQTERNIRCSYPIYIKNGFITMYNVTIWEDQTYTGQITYECNYGFETFNGNDQIQSECVNGTWTYVGDCQEIPTCPKQDLLGLESQVENSYVHNVSLQYVRDPWAFVYDSYVFRVCLPNFEHDPSSPPLKIQCQRETNTWTGIPICRAIKTATVTTSMMISTESEEILIESNIIESTPTLTQTTKTTEITPTEREEIRLKSDAIDSTFDLFRTTTLVPSKSETINTILIPFETTTTVRIPTEDKEIVPRRDTTDTILIPFETTTTVRIPTGDKETIPISDTTNAILTSFQTTTMIVLTKTEEIQFESDTSSQIFTLTQTTTMPPVETKEIQLENDTISTSLIPLQTTMKIETMTSVFDITQSIVCHSNELPMFPNLILNEVKLNLIYGIGAKLVFTCSFGYESLNNATSFTICSTNGTWTMDNIIPNMCQLQSQTSEKISLDVSTISSELIEEKNNTDYFDENLPILNISNETLISSTQSMSAGSRQIRHLTTYCEQLPQIDHAQLLSDDTLKHNFTNQISYSGSILFACQFGFLSNTSGDEPFRLTCEKGIFHPKVVCIEKPRCSLPPPIDSSRSSIIDSAINVFDTSTEEAIPGSFITLNCIDKKNDEQSIFNMTCLDNGKWTTLPPPCIAPFRRRCQSGIAIPNARTQIHAKLTMDGYYDDGSRATYRCLENFVHDRQSGPLHIQCRNGRWGPRPICIPNGCLEPLPDTIENGWKSAESYVVHSDTKYYLLTRYSCHDNALLVDLSARVIDIECQYGQWQYKTLPVCQLQESNNTNE